MEGVDSMEGRRVMGGNIERIGHNECLTPLEIAKPAEWARTLTDVLTWEPIHPTPTPASIDLTLCY